MIIERWRREMARDRLFFFLLPIFVESERDHGEVREIESKFIEVVQIAVN